MSVPEKRAMSDDETEKGITLHLNSMKRTSKQQQKLAGRGGADQPAVVDGQTPAANIRDARVGGVNAE